MVTTRRSIATVLGATPVLSITVAVGSIEKSGVVMALGGGSGLAKTIPLVSVKAIVPEASARNAPDLKCLFSLSITP